MRTLLISVLAAAAGCTAGGETVRTLNQSWAFQPGQRIYLDVPIGEITVVGIDSGPVSLDLRVRCSQWRRRCPADAEDVEIRSRKLDRALRLEVEGLPRWAVGALSIEAELNVPHGAPVLVDLGVGEVEVHGVRSDIDVDVGVGAVEIALDADWISAVEAHTGIGASTVHRSGDVIEGQRSLLGDELRWSLGQGESRIFVEVGVGDVDVDLL